MIKSENYGKNYRKLPKIPEIYRKIPLKTLKIFAELCSATGGSGLAGQGGFFRFFDDRGDFRLIPPLFISAIDHKSSTIDQI